MDPDKPTFQDRMYAASEDVYDLIEHNNGLHPIDVEAALNHAHDSASSDQQR